MQNNPIPVLDHLGELARKAVSASGGKEDREKRKNSHKLTKVAVFRYAYYQPLFKFFVEQVLDCEYIWLPEATRRTMDLGIKYSNDYVCTPFKHMMGDYIEALELGADLLVQVGGPCRLGFYGEMQEKILCDEGYEFEMLNFSHGIEQGYIGWAKEVLRKVNPDIDIPYGVKRLLSCVPMMESLDAVRDYYMKEGGFELERGSFKKAWNAALEEFSACASKQDILRARNDAFERMRQIPTEKPADPIRIGIVGELYTAIDENSNLGLDEKLMGMGAEIYRELNFSNRYLHYNEANRRKSVSDYVRFDAGPTSTLTIQAAKKYAEAGFDGVIHAKCAGCTPEIDCIPILRRISEDYEMPMLFLTYDTETSDTGLMTRLEAFYDMLSMSKEAKLKGKART